eukprot:scaffold7887_cov138-Cylindrotheca_fusiformis.AAC.2
MRINGFAVREREEAVRNIFATNNLNYRSHKFNLHRTRTTKQFPIRIIIMCWPTNCPNCGKATYGGCGNHIQSVLGSVKEEDRCPNWKNGGIRNPCTAK